MKFEVDLSLFNNFFESKTKGDWRDGERGRHGIPFFISFARQSLSLSHPSLLLSYFF